MDPVHASMFSHECHAPNKALNDQPKDAIDIKEFTIVEYAHDWDYKIGKMNKALFKQMSKIVEDFHNTVAPCDLDTVSFILTRTDDDGVQLMARVALLAVERGTVHAVVGHDRSNGYYNTNLINTLNLSESNVREIARIRALRDAELRLAKLMEEDDAYTYEPRDVRFIPKEHTEECRLEFVKRPNREKLSKNFDFYKGHH